MKNEKNITIQDLEKCYKPLVWDSCDKISNLSDETVGYYAYLLQEELNKRDLLAIGVLVSDNNGGVKNGVLVSEPLQKITLPIVEPSITYKADEFNNAKSQLEHYNNPEQREKLIAEMGQENFDERIRQLEEASKTPMILHQFELFFRVWSGGVGSPIVLRNGYLLKCLNEAGIKTFEELDEYEAVLIYNRAKVNGHYCSFVKFEKKNH